MASDADKTMSEPRRARRRPAAAAEGTGRGENRLRRRRLQAEDTSEEKALAVGKGRATPSRREADEEDEKQGGNIATRTVSGLGEYFQGVRSELRKVAWPTTEDTRRLSIIVLITLVLTSLALGAISLAFTELFRFGLGNPLILIVFMVVAVGAGVLISRRSSS